MGLHAGPPFVIMVGFLCNSALALAALRRVMAIKPDETPIAISAWLAGVISAGLMSIGLTAATVWHELSLSLGAMVMMVGLVVGLQLLLITRRDDPPADDQPIDEPDPPPSLIEPRPRHRHPRRQRPTQPCRPCRRTRRPELLPL